MQTELSVLVPNLKVLYQIMNEVNDKLWLRRWLYGLLNKKNPLIVFSSSIKVKFFTVRIDYL